MYGILHMSISKAFGYLLTMVSCQLGLGLWLGLMWPGLLIQVVDGGWLLFNKLVECQ
jgi:hypothetical protein